MNNNKADGVKLDINDLRSRRDTKDRKISLDDLRYDEMIDAQLERYRNKDKMTMADIMAMQELEDMKWERRQRMRAETEQQKPQIDIEEIIRKAQEPLQKQIEEMKRQQEKQEEERKWDAIQKQIDDLKNLIMSGSTKKSDDDPIMLQIQKQMQELQEELRDEKEKARKKEEEDFKNSMKNMIYDLSDQIAELKSKPEKSKSDFEQIIELEKKKKEMLDALGVRPEKKDDEANALDMVDAFADRAPKIAKSVNTIKELFSKDSEIPDDVPDDVPTNLPQRNEPIPQRSMVPDDIKAFLDKGHEENGTYIDYAGTPWVNLEGQPISRKDIEDASLTNPEDIRRLMRETDEAYKKQQEKKNESKEGKEKKSNDVIIKNNERVHTAPPPEAKEPEKEPEPEKEEKKEENNDALNEAIEYINSGSDTDTENGKIWIGKNQEYYNDDEGKPLTKDELMDMAKENPEEFMHDVREHLKSLKGEGNGE